MGHAATHLGIQVREYDARIRTFIPFYEEILDAGAATFAAAVAAPAPVIVDLGIGSGAFARRCLAERPRARVIGIDLDDDMLAMARRRLGQRFDSVVADFQASALPRADAVIASFALHHVRTMTRKAALYARIRRALRPGGALVVADCFLASSPRVRAADRQQWMGHLARRYGARRAAAFLRAWAKEDVYFTLASEIRSLGQAGFNVDVVWRRASFGVLVGTLDR
jgi:ubiquinone/menaquinone biosynthesis C-methylase UbiE